MINKFTLYLLALIAIPVGLLIAKYGHDELKSGKKYFIAICILSIIGIWAGYWINNILFAVGSIFLGIVSYVSYFMSRRGKL